MIKRPRGQFDREGDCTLLGELVPVEAQGEAGLATRFEVAARLRDVERPTFQEYVGRFRKLRRIGQDVVESEIEVCVSVCELRRNGMRAKPCRNSARVPNGAKRREFR